jgi:hypothetical protein
MSSASLNAPDLPATILILAPQGMECQAIAQGLSLGQQGKPPRFSVQSIPVGSRALLPFFKTLGETWTTTPKPQALLVMGVTGSLNSHYGIGQPVWVTECQLWPQGTTTELFQGDVNLSRALDTRLIETPKNPSPRFPFVKGVTTNQVIDKATEKQTLAHQSGADVVDMENVAILQFAQHHNLPAAILRVVSDTVEHDLPDLRNIYDPQGQLKPWSLAARFIQHPLAAARLIQGSLTACGVLKQLARQLVRLG